MGGAWAELGLPTSVLGVKKQHLSFNALDIVLNFDLHRFHTF